MVVSTFRIVLTLLFLSFWFTAFGQDDWDVPWQVIGDSSNLHQRKMLSLQARSLLKVPEKRYPGLQFLQKHLNISTIQIKTDDTFVELPPGIIELW